jgi:UDP-2,4-diacetamido-2,4,6-trideoxy-beta-L-altropyranose hydrolase
MGHIQRCLALSSQPKKNGAGILSISKKDEVIKKRIKQERFEVMGLKDNMELKVDLRETLNTIKAYTVDVLITNSYAIDEHYLAEIKRIVPLLVSIDDLANISFSSDIVIDQNIYAKDLNYHSLTGKTISSRCRICSLREEFSNPGKRSK